MVTLSNSPTNLKKIMQLYRLLAEALKEVLRRGFFGACLIELSVQDGTIQHVRLRVERIET